MEDLTAEFAAAQSRGEVVAISGDMPLFANWNVAPTQMIPVLRIGGSERTLEIEPMRWGLVPSWSKDPSKGAPLINARSETVTEKPSFRNLVAHHRCIVPMNGFYEWDRSDAKNKIPYYVPRADGRLMWVLGLWSRPPVLDGLATVTMLTCASTGELAAVHDRSPVQVELDEAIDWACDDRPPLGSLENPRLSSVVPRRVTRAVNSIRNNGPHLLDPPERDDSPAEQPGLF